jgi:hypothetical protein
VERFPHADDYLLLGAVMKLPNRKEIEDLSAWGEPLKRSISERQWGKLRDSSSALSLSRKSWPCSSMIPRLRDSVWHI